MISGAFHPMAQEWRYYSREKSLIHTLHLAELPTTITGQSIIIAPAVPTGTGNSNGFNVGPIILPDITPYNGIDINRTTNNIPPYWQYGVGFGMFPPSAHNPTGTYSMSGTFTLPGVPTFNYQLEVEWWPYSGGAFLVICNNYPHIYTDVNQAGISDGSRIDMFNGTIKPDFQNGYPSLQSADSFVQMVGDNWVNMTVWAPGNFGVSAILQNVLPFSNIAYWIHPSPFFNNGFSSWGNFDSLIMRLGP